MQSAPDGTGSPRGAPNDSAARSSPPSVAADARAALDDAASISKRARALQDLSEQTFRDRAAPADGPEDGVDDERGSGQVERDAELGCLLDRLAATGDRVLGEDIARTVIGRAIARSIRTTRDEVGEALARGLNGLLAASRDAPHGGVSDGTRDRAGQERE